MVVLIGPWTQYLRRFVHWEMEQALDLGLPIIGVNLNALRQQDPDKCPPIIRKELAVYVSFNRHILQHALENWPETHYSFKRQGKSGRIITHKVFMPNWDYEITSFSFQEPLEKLRTVLGPTRLAPSLNYSRQSERPFLVAIANMNEYGVDTGSLEEMKEVLRGLWGLY